MRIRLREGELRVYLGEEGYSTLTKAEIVARLMKMKKGHSYMRHARSNGLWVCINSINRKRYKINPDEI